MSSFVTPDTARLELGDGKWVEIRSTLSYGERMNLAKQALVAKPGPDGQYVGVIDVAAYHLARLREYVVDWNLHDASGKTVPVSAATINNLTQEAADELNAALDAHVREQEAKKAGAPTTNGSIPTSRSAGS